jgi:two-component system nitrogen regulation response regulator GlnG
MATKPVWIVDDDRSIRWVLEKALERDGIAYQSFVSAAEVLQALGSGDPCVLVSDIRMPGESGLVLLEKVKERFPRLPVIIMTAYSDLDSAVAAFQGGAFEYLPKPFDVDHAVALIRRAMAESSAQTTVEPAAAAAAEMLGQAPAMQDVFRAIGRLSQSSATVLITGESGTGKELVARALHRHSPRAAGPFIAINTAAIPKDLLESELFGHERGAFTGAQSARRGRFEQAEGGTLFLDEIGDMPSDLQVRLLRVLADGEYYRVGGHAPQKSNVRVIAATHQNLEERVRLGLFREDLLHRLDVVRVRLPPLRERQGRHCAARPSLPREERARARGGGESAVGGRVKNAVGVSVPGQRAAAREHLPLDHGDGARPAGRDRGPARRAARACDRGRGLDRGRSRLAHGARPGACACACARRARRRRASASRIQAHAHPALARAYGRSPARSCAVARLGAQHTHEEDPGARARAGAAEGRRRLVS